LVATQGRHLSGRFMGLRAMTLIIGVGAFNRSG
jgi:hypothetical protein